MILVGNSFRISLLETEGVWSRILTSQDQEDKQVPGASRQFLQPIQGNVGNAPPRISRLRWLTEIATRVSPTEPAIIARALVSSPGAGKQAFCSGHNPSD